MAGRAIIKRQIAKLPVWLAVCRERLRMALKALNFLVGTGELKTRFCMVVLSRILPAGSVVAGLALRGQLPAMLVPMAGPTFAAQSEKRAAAVLDRDFGGVGPCNARGLMTLVADQGGMASGQRIACALVIEVFRLRFPANQVEIPAMMFGMAAAARFPSGFRAHQTRVQAAPGLEPALDFPMTIQALPRRGLSVEYVAIHTVPRALERSMGSR